MKILDIALKDLLRSFRSYFALVFMFGVPLLMTGIFYLAFGSMTEEEGFSVPQTKVAVVNLDKTSFSFDLSQMGELSPETLQAMENLQGEFGMGEAGSMGEMMLSILDSENLADLIAVQNVDRADVAREMVDRQEVGLALIIPENFSNVIFGSEAETSVEIYQDPTLTLGPAIVKTLLQQFVDGFSANRISIGVINEMAASQGVDLQEDGMNRYLDSILGKYAGDVEGSQEDFQSGYFNLVSPQGESSAEGGIQLERLIATILGGMMIFFAFFTGTAGAQSILEEEEQGTMQRLFTTPTQKSMILRGKFLSVGLMIVIQVLVLLLAGYLIFGIQWGSIGRLVLLDLGITLAAGGFGLFIISLLKNSRQVGAIYGGVITITGMLGVMRVFLTGATAGFTETVSLFVPQGWAMRALMQSMDQAEFSRFMFSFGILCLWGLVMFMVARQRFSARFG